MHCSYKISIFGKISKRLKVLVLIFRLTTLVTPRCRVFQFINIHKATVAIYAAFCGFFKNRVCVKLKFFLRANDIYIRNLNFIYYVSENKS